MYTERSAWCVSTHVGVHWVRVLDCPFIVLFSYDPGVRTGPRRLRGTKKNTKEYFYVMRYTLQDRTFITAGYSAPQYLTTHFSYKLYNYMAFNP